MTRRKTVLVVDDDPGILRVLADGLANVLDMFDVLTASHGQEAVEILERRDVDVLVTDLVMPIMDGFALIAYLTNRGAPLPVVVLSGMAAHAMEARLSGYAGLRILRKPTSYQAVAQCVLEEIERIERGQVRGIPLAGVLQLLEAERRSCTVLVRSGKRRGRLHFESGTLLNAFSEDFGAEGEAAAFDILGWTDTAIEFAPLPPHVRRLVHTPLQLMLLDLAAMQDRAPGGGAAPEGAVPDPADVDPRSEPSPVDGPAAAATEPASPLELAEAEAAPVHAQPFGAPDDEGGEGGEPGAEPDVDGPGVDGPLEDPAPPAAVAPLETTPTEAMAEEPTTIEPSPAGPEALAAPAAMGTAPADPEPVPAPSAPAPAAPVPAAPVAASPGSGDPADHLLAAMDRLAARAREAEAALAAVADEVTAFQAARRRFDEIQERRERQRRELESFRDDVARLAREILGRVDGLFDAMVADAAGTEGEPPRTAP